MDDVKRQMNEDKTKQKKERVGRGEGGRGEAGSTAG